MGSLPQSASTRIANDLPCLFDAQRPHATPDRIGLLIAMLLIPVVDQLNKACSMVGSGCSSLADCAFKSQACRWRLISHGTPGRCGRNIRFIHKVGGDHHRDAFLYHAMMCSQNSRRVRGSTPDVGSSETECPVHASANRPAPAAV